MTALSPPTHRSRFEARSAASTPRTSGPLAFGLAVALATALAGCDKFTPPVAPPPATGPAPETTITGAPTRTRLRTLSLQLGSSEPSAEFRCRLDAEPFAPCAAAYTRADVAPGVHTFQAFAMLADGRFDATPASATFEIVGTPIDTFITSAPPAVTISTTAVIEFRAGEEGLTFECSLDGEGFTATDCTGRRTLMGLAAGPHHFRVRATDGQVADASPAEVRWTIDNSAPVVTLSGRPTDIVSEPQFTFTFQANEELVRLFCQLDAGVAAPCTSPHTVTGLAPGTHQFSVYAVDAAGNRSAPDTAGFTVQWNLGVACGVATDCKSGFCRDGVCCDEACDGVCRSCAIARGTCRSVRNAPDPDSCLGENTCDDNSTCAASSGTGDGFEATSSRFRFRGRFPSGVVEAEGARYRFRGLLQSAP